jgi:hypothetical protein
MKISECIKTAREQMLRPLFRRLQNMEPAEWESPIAAVPQSADDEGLSTRRAFGANAIPGCLPTRNEDLRNEGRNAPLCMFLGLDARIRPIDRATK